MPMPQRAEEPRHAIYPCSLVPLSQRWKEEPVPIEVVTSSQRLSQRIERDKFGRIKCEKQRSKGILHLPQES
eukprot:5422000-Amphidinium_carterae.1